MGSAFTLASLSAWAALSENLVFIFQAKWDSTCRVIGGTRFREVGWINNDLFDPRRFDS